MQAIGCPPIMQVVQRCSAKAGDEAAPA